MKSDSAPVRLLAIDIDGTLLNSAQQIPPRNSAALRRAHDSGVAIALVTGRRHSFAAPIARELGFELCLISSNGAVTKSLAGDLFYRDLLPASVARDLIVHMDEFRAQAVLTFDVEGAGALAVEQLEALSTSVRGWLQQNRQSISIIQPLEAALVSDPVQLMYCGGIARMAVAEQLLLGPARRRDVTMLKTQYLARDLALLDILNRECSKGHALARWAAHLRIDAAETAAIGDNYNDAEMLNFAGRPYIMENACAELKQNGWTRALSNDHCGVAEVIEQLLRENRTA